jgi:hypothetical protein
MPYSPRLPRRSENEPLVSRNSSASLRITNTASYQPVLEHISTLEKCIQQVILLTGQLIEKQSTVDVGSFHLQQLSGNDLFDEQQKKNFPTESRNSRPLPPHTQFSTNQYKCFSCCQTNQQKDNQPLPSLRLAVDSMLAALIQFLYANNRFIRTELVSIQSVGDILAFHTLSYALKDMVEATTDLARNARRIKHIDTRTLIRAECDEGIS